MNSPLAALYSTPHTAIWNNTDHTHTSACHTASLPLSVPADCARLRAALTNCHQSQNGIDPEGTHDMYALYNTHADTIHPHTK